MPVATGTDRNERPLTDTRITAQSLNKLDPAMPTSDVVFFPHLATGRRRSGVVGEGREVCGLGDAAEVVVVQSPIASAIVVFAYRLSDGGPPITPADKSVHSRLDGIRTRTLVISRNAHF